MVKNRITKQNLDGVAVSTTAQRKSRTTSSGAKGMAVRRSLAATVTTTIVTDKRTTVVWWCREAEHPTYKSEQNFVAHLVTVHKLPLQLVVQ